MDCLGLLSLRSVVACRDTGGYIPSLGRLSESALNPSPPPSPPITLTRFEKASARIEIEGDDECPLGALQRPSLSRSFVLLDPSGERIASVDAVSVRGLDYDVGKPFYGRDVGAHPIQEKNGGSDCRSPNHSTGVGSEGDGRHGDCRQVASHSG